MRRLTRFLRRFKKQMILGPAFKMLEAVFELIVPLVMAGIIDVGIRRQDAAYVWRMGGLLVLLGGLGLASSLTCQFFASRASQGFGTLVRGELFAHIGKLSHAEIDRMGTPSLITRLNNDVNQLQLAVAMLIRLVFRAPFLALGATVMAMMLDLRMSLIFVAASALIALTLYLVMSRSAPGYLRIQRLLDRVSLITRENLEGARVVRAFSRAPAEQKRFDGAALDLCRANLRVTRLSALLSPATSVIANAAVIAIVWTGGLRVDAGTLTQGEVIALWNYMTQILLALIVVANLVVIFTKAGACAERVNEVFDTAPSVADSADGAPVSPVPGAPKITFQNVSFTYPGGARQSLYHISFSVAAGESLGVIGGTGSGKTTLVNLIPRFYDAQEGRVLVDGVDVERYPLSQLRGSVGYVPQASVLFSGTLRSNLQWGDETASDERIKRALETAQAADFVREMPAGLDTPVLQGGKNLSGGQKQRLCIARALVRSPDILILDDSASALDFATDAALRKALARAAKERDGGMTVLTVSQRAAAVRGSDRILVLDNGAAVGLGTHAELFASCAVYREICLSQQSEEEARRA